MYRLIYLIITGGSPWKKHLAIIFWILILVFSLNSCPCDFSVVLVTSYTPF